MDNSRRQITRGNLEFLGRGFPLGYMPRLTTAPSVKTAQKAHTPNDLFKQFWRKGVPFGTLDQKF